MQFEEAISQLQSLAVKKGIDYRLQRLNPVLEGLGDPHLNLPPVIHVAGTNGKGSTVAFIRAILMEAGYSVGTFSSPHLISYTERIQINALSISEADFCDYFERCKPFHEQGLTEFETLTMMALCYFRDKAPDFCVVEVGLGGRLDSTNVVIPSCAVITTIAKDHEKILGSELFSIAAEKAGIIKPNCPVVTSSTQSPEVQRVLRETAAEKGVKLYEESPLESLPEGLSLSGDVQKVNASLAIKAIRLVLPNCSESVIEKGLKNAEHWGRFTVLEREGKEIVIDAAHNLSGLETLRQTMNRRYPGRSVTVVFGLHKDRLNAEILEAVSALGERLYFCEFDSVFSARYEDLCALGYSHIELFELTQELPEGDLLLCTGSIYFIGLLKSRI